MSDSEEVEQESLRPPAICECGSRLSAGGWCGTCREFIWRIR